MKAGGFELEASFTLEKGEYFSIIGPTGSGKTLLLETIAGLKKPLSGRIFFDGIEITHLPPRLRGVGYVPQDCALFPHLKVKENICFACGEWNEELSALCEELEISHLLHRNPSTLSGGEVQRVALARALAIHPRLLLLDEPLSSLDINIKKKLWFMLRRIHREYKLNILHVTHDFEEAFVLSEKLMVLKNGRVMQIGDKKEILMHPACKEVADFTGAKNIFEGEVIRKDNGLLISWQGGIISTMKYDYNVGDKVYFCIRPEHVMLIRPNRELGKPVRENLMDGEIVEDIDRGTAHTLVFKADSGVMIEIDLPKHAYERLGVRRHKRVRISLKKSAIHVFNS